MARLKLKCIMGCAGLKSSYREKGLLQKHETNYLFFSEYVFQAMSQW